MHRIVAAIAVFVCIPFCFAQTAAPAGSSPASVIGKPSELITPALDGLAKAGSGVDLNKWKGSAVIKQEVDGNLASIQKDLQATLPPLIIAADAAPTSASASMPVLLNMDALYNVVLRVSIAGKGNAPRDQADALDGALATLDGARRDLGERIVKLASSNEKQLAVMQTTLQQQAATIAAAQQAAAAAPPPPTTTKKKRAAKPAAKPAPKPAATQ